MQYQNEEKHSHPSNLRSVVSSASVFRRLLNCPAAMIIGRNLFQESLLKNCSVLLSIFTQFNR